jgi:hypothetical protein
VRFTCEFEHEHTGEHRTVPVALSAMEVRSLRDLTRDAEVIAEAMALRHAYAEVPNGFRHTKPPKQLQLS